MKTLEELISRNHHENEHGMILKMDVEGAEWGFLSNVSSEMLAKFDQMTFVFHDIINPENPELVIEVFQKINRTHQLIHIHANNFGGKKFCSLFELTYVLRDKYSLSENCDVNLPLSIDAPNIADYPEIELVRWNEKARIDDRFTAVIKTI